MIGVKSIIDKLNDLLTDTSLSELEINQLYSAIYSIENTGVSSVATVVDLPNPVLNKGRFIFINSENRYVFSNGAIWDINNIIAAADAGKLLAWGSGGDGRLGDNSTVNKSSPVSVVGGFTDWVQVSAGYLHSLGLRANGVAYAWGFNSDGRLGDGTIVAKSSPVSVIGGFTDWVHVSGGEVHSLGVRANGTAWAWGASGTSGRLGDGTTVNKSSPVSVVGGFTDWVQVSGGRDHSLGLRANGVAYAWGYNGQGRLGDDTTVNRSSPVSVVGGFTDWVQVSGGRLHSLGLRANGTAWGWGTNTFGRLGDDTTVNRSSPVSVVGGFTDWVQLSAGSFHILGLRANGTAWAWGAGTNGRLGDGTIVDKSSPVSVVGGFTDWVQISAGSFHSLAVRANGVAYAWGRCDAGQLGDDTIVNKSSPVSVVGGFTDWVQVSGGGIHSLGLRG